MQFIQQDNHFEKLENFKFINYEPSEISFYNNNREIFFTEPSLAAVKKENGIILAAGKEALQAKDNREIPVVAGSYLKNGVIAEFGLSSNIFRYFFYKIKKITGRKLFSRPTAAMCVPVDMTQVERQAYTELMYSVGVKKPLIIEDTYKNAVFKIQHDYKIVIEITS